MCVLYMSFGSKIIFECVAISSSVLFILRSRLLVYSTGSVYGCKYCLAARVLVYVYVIVMSSA